MKTTLYTIYITLLFSCVFDVSAQGDSLLEENIQVIQFVENSNNEEILNRKSIKNANKLSEELLLAVKTESETSQLESQLANLTLDDLSSQLKDDTYKKAFWINIYNATYQMLRKKKNRGVYLRTIYNFLKTDMRPTDHSLN